MANMKIILLSLVVLFSMCFNVSAIIITNYTTAPLSSIDCSVTSDCNNLIDGNYATTYDTSHYANDFFNVTLSSTYPIGKIELIRFGSAGDNRPGNFTISVWNSTTSLWDNVGNNTLTGTVTNFTFTFSNRTTNRFRFEIIDGSPNLFANDVKVYIVNSTKNESLVNSATFNSTTNELVSETFILNTTANATFTPTSALFIYGGTAYTTTKTTSGSNIIFTNTVTIPTGIGTKSLIWQLSNGTTNHYNFTGYTHEVFATNLTRCGSGTPYINFTYKDETSGSYINGSSDLASWTYWIGSSSVYKTLLFTNTTSNPSTAFCFTPVTKSMGYSLTYQYSMTGYPQRYFTSSGTLTNTTTNQVLYLLGSADGIYSTIAVQNNIGNSPISGAVITAEREISGTWVTIGQATTDSAGQATFWVNPNYDHRFTVVKTGYTTEILTIRPTQSVYTLMLGSTTATYQNYTWEGIRTYSIPKPGQLSPNTAYLFQFNTSASFANIVNCKIEIRNSSSDILSTGTAAAINSGANCSVSVTYNTASQDRLYGYYYLDLGSGYGLFKANDAWFMENYTTKNYNIFSALKDLGEMEDWGESHNRREFSKIVAFFFILTIMIGSFSYFTGVEFSQPGAGLILLWVAICLASFAGIFTIEGLSSLAWFNKYTIAAVTTFICWGFLLNHWRRSSQ